MRGQQIHERSHLPCTKMAIGCGTGDEPDGNLISRAEKRLEGAQEEIRGERDGVEEEGAGGWEEGCIRVALV